MTVETIDKGRPWRMVEVARTCCADPMWGERESAGRFTWRDGTAPAKPGVVCDAAWQPIAVEDLADMLPPTGGFHREQATAQRNAWERWPPCAPVLCAHCEQVDA